MLRRALGDPALVAGARRRIRAPGRPGRGRRADGGRGRRRGGRAARGGRPARRRGAERGGARALSRGPARRGRRLGRSASRAARRGARHAAPDRVRGPAGARRRRHRRPRGRDRRAPLPGAALGAADHGPLRAGRQADALAAYQRVRARLADDLGLEPGPRLRELEGRVLGHDPALPVAGRPAATAGNLPSLAAGLVGRDAEIAALSGLLGDRRLVEVVGPGGIGKTAVAIATGRALAGVPGGVWLARLETAQTADDVLDTIIAAMAVTGGEPALVDRLRRVASVLILDNCEHVLDAAATLAERLLDAAPALRILATSQAALDVDGEAVVELAPLALEDAVELFTRRAARPGTAGDVHDLCRSLDGLPLAIELAAARTRTLSVVEIARRLDDRFALLSDPTSRRPERRRALKATIGWSYELLFPDDKRGLWALSTFTGGASLEAVESVLAALDVPPAAAIDVVGRLAGRSLLIVDDAADPPVPAPRQHPRVRARGDGGRRAHRSRARRARRVVRGGGGRIDRGRAERPAGGAPRLRPDRARERRRGAGLERRPRSAARARDRQRVRLGVDRPRRQPRRAAPPGRARRRRRRGAGPRPRHRAPAGRVDRGVDGPPGAGAPPRGRRDGPGRRDRRPRPAGALRLPPRVRRVPPRRVGARPRAHGAQPRALRGPGPAVGPGRERAVRRRAPRSRPATGPAHGRRATRCSIGSRSSTTRGCTSAATRCSANWPGSSAASTTRSATSRGRRRRRRASASSRPRPTRCRASAGRSARRATTTRAPRRSRRRSGRRRPPATCGWRRSPASISAASCARSAGTRRRARRSRRRRRGTATRAGESRPRSATACSRRSTPATGWPARRGASARSSTRARRDDDGPVEVFALDALARLASDAGDAAAARDLSEAADRRMETASHFITERDRTDARAVTPSA